MKYEKEVLSGLKKASNKSKREGKWSTIPETRDYSKGVPIDIKIRPVLMQLVKENRAEKKRADELWRPVGVGGGGIGTAFGNYGRDQSGRPTSPDVTGGRDGGRNGSPNGAPEEIPDPRNTVGAAVGAMFAGGLAGGGSTGGSSVPSVR